MNSPYHDEGWQQVRAGISLVTWSRLAHLDTTKLVFSAAVEDDFEFGSGHPKIHEEFGRLICWIIFSVGGEYLIKGTCMLKGKHLTSSVDVIRGPEWDESITAWIKSVNSNDVGIKSSDVSLGSLGQIPVGSITGLGSDRDMVSAAIRFLASAIRNRDAHRYAPNVRARHFKAVPCLFVPAFNALLGCLDQNELRSRLAGVQSA